MKNFKLEPYDDKVVIKPHDRETISKGGVYIPEGSQPEATFGEVVAVGPGLRNMFNVEDRASMRTKVGDKVFYPKFGAHKLEHDGEDYVVIKEGDLFVREEKKEFQASDVNKEEVNKVLEETEPFETSDVLQQTLEDEELDIEIEDDEK